MKKLLQIGIYESRSRKIVTQKKDRVKICLDLFGEPEFIDLITKGTKVDMENISKYKEKYNLTKEEFFGTFFVMNQLIELGGKQWKK